VSALKENIEHDIEYNINCYESYLSPAQKVYIWGTGSAGEITYKKLSERGISVCSFIDNNKEKRGTEFCSISIIHPDDMVDNKKERIIIIASMYYKTIIQQIKRMGNKNTGYFVSVAHEHCPSEFSQSRFSQWLKNKLRKYCGFYELQDHLNSVTSKMEKRFGDMEINLNRGLGSDLKRSLSALDDLSNRYLLTDTGRQEMDVRYHDLMLLLNEVIHYSAEQPFFSVRTEARIAFDSNDYKVPYGTKNDNTRSPRFVAACERHFLNEKIKHIDLGCSGGGLVLDFLLRGHDSIGLEGSDYSQKSLRATWRLLEGRNLFTTDITKPFQIVGPSGMEYMAHIISAWEVMEHIKEEDIPVLFENVKKHMLPNGIFIGSIALTDDIIDGIQYHPTVKSRDWWTNKFSESGLPFSDNHSFDSYDYCRGSGNGVMDRNFESEPDIGLHFVSRFEK
jgi:hypothetical protein